MRADDLALLEVLFPGKVNEVARDVLHQYCEHLLRSAGDQVLEARKGGQDDEALR
jgi:hypothetical protein